VNARISGTSALVRRTHLRLDPDPSRVVTQLFVAGEELTSGSSRTNPVMQRVLGLDDATAATLLADVIDRFAGRHRDLRQILLAHFARIRGRLGSVGELTQDKQMLLGAYATNEVSVEAAALCNPSIVAHPDQEGLAAGELRFILSLRAIGEGHISSIEFRTGVVGPDDEVRIDDPGPLLVGARIETSSFDRATFRALLGEALRDHETAARIFDGLPTTFSAAELDIGISGLHRQHRRREASDIIDRLRTIAACNYNFSFPSKSALAERVLVPHSPSESAGMEDARFVRFVEDDGGVTYYATYTAFDGSTITPQMVSTPDFLQYSVFQLTGRAATNKGMALFPRRINGRYTMLSRWDRESIAVATSSDGRHWESPLAVHGPQAPWELIQVGNCGSPIETPQGWLVLTHGVGPMRTYSLGAMLLALDDPTKVLGVLDEPLLAANSAERDGYVPNVVYTCGAMLHGETLVLPYAYGDMHTSIALLSLPALLDELQR
jgi:predicted GH43/DUF377 family glycosyl hydrolase